MTRSWLVPPYVRSNSKSSNISNANSSRMFVVVAWETHRSLSSLRSIGTFDLAARVRWILEQRSTF